MRIQPARFLPGTQVAYIPPHANGDINHPDVEFGFVTSLHPDGEGCFCRYFLKDCPAILRTVSCSELTNYEFLVVVEHHPQQWIDDLLQAIRDFSMPQP